MAMKNEVDNSLITIGITCYNAEDSIDRAIQSAIKQDWSNIEIIVVDDKSNDSSWNIISKAAQENSRVRAYQHTENGGPAATRNSILNYAKGEFVAFFDDDDESFPNRIRMQYQTIVDYENVSDAELVACYASGSRRYDNGYEVSINAIGSQLSPPRGELVADYLLFNQRQCGTYYGAGTPTCSLMARLLTFKKVGYFDASLRRVEDVDLAIRLALLGGHFIGCKEPLFRQYATVALDKTPIKNYKSELILVNKYADYLEKKNRLYYAKSWFRIRYYHFSSQRRKFLFNLLMLWFRYPFALTVHLFRTVPSRFIHEKKMRR